MPPAACAPQFTVIVCVVMMVAGFLLYFFLRKNPVYLVDFSVYRAPERCAENEAKPLRWMTCCMLLPPARLPRKPLTRHTLTCLPYCAHLQLDGDLRPLHEWVKELQGECVFRAGGGEAHLHASRTAGCFTQAHTHVAQLSTQCLSCCRDSRLSP